MVSTRGPKLRTPLTAVAVAVAVIAAACAGWFGWSWYRSAHSASISAARQRDAALREGQQAILNFNTLDYRHISQGLKLWQQSSTGTLLRDISTDRSSFEKEVSKAKTITTAMILDDALTSLNTRAGTAVIIAAVQITVKPAAGSASTKQTRLVGTLQRTRGVWKLSTLGQAPVGTAG